MMTECPSCALEIEEDAETCPYCGYEIPKQKNSTVLMAIVILLIMLWPIYKLLQFLLG